MQDQDLSPDGVKAYCSYEFINYSLSSFASTFNQAGSNLKGMMAGPLQLIDS